MWYDFFYKEKPATSKENFGTVRQYYMIARAGYQLGQTRLVSVSKLSNFNRQIL